MTTQHEPDEWPVIESLLPDGWSDKARELGAFRRARYLPDPASLLRLLLLHGVGNSLRETATMAEAAGLARLSPVALHLRMKTSVEWLRWIAAELSQRLRQETVLAGPWRPRAVDSTAIQGPRATNSEWRLHYALDLRTLQCDWHELTDAKIPESLTRTPVEPYDVLVADRNYLTHASLAYVMSRGAHLLVRMRWKHLTLRDARGKSMQVLSLTKGVRVSRPSEFKAWAEAPGGSRIPVRIVIIRLPKPIAERNRQKLKIDASKRQRTFNPQSYEAAGFVFLLTTIPAESLGIDGVTALYRHRWQIEIAFKRHKQLLEMGQLPCINPQTAQAWILIKLILALLLETMYRNAGTISPWGYRMERLRTPG